MRKPHRQQAICGGHPQSPVSVAVGTPVIAPFRFGSLIFGGVNEDLPSMIHPWDPWNVTQNCLKTSIQTSLRVNHCVGDP